jgi:hypothetical protein
VHAGLKNIAPSITSMLSLSPTTNSFSSSGDKRSSQTTTGRFLPVATGSYGQLTANHGYEAFWSDRMQTAGQVECSIPIGIPTKNKNRYLCYKSICY